MNGQLILREWKEKAGIPLFALAFLVIFIVIALVAAQRGEVLDILIGTILLVFLPMTAVLLGAGAFGSELKDGAWAYLFSRPVKKSTIWFSKLIALFAYLAAILLFYFIVLSLIPGVREHIAGFTIPWSFAEDISIWTVSVVLSVSLFIIAFSLSILTDRQLQVIFLSGFVFAGLAVVLVTAFLSVLYLHDEFEFMIPVVWVLVAVSLGASSLLAFCRRDFSQPREKTLGFLKTLGLFLIASAVVAFAAARIGEGLARTTFLLVRSSGGTALIDSSRGVYRFDAEKNKLERFGRLALFGEGSDVSEGTKQLVWIRYVIPLIGGPRQARQEIWMMDENGRHKRPVLRPSKSKDDPLSRGLMDCSLSRDGRRIVFSAWPDKRSGGDFLWSVNSDGSGLKSYNIDIPDIDWVSCFGWTKDDRHVIYRVMQKTVKAGESRLPGRNMRFLKLSVESGVWQEFGEDAGMSYWLGLSPDGNKFGGTFSSPGPEIPEPSEPRHPGIAPLRVLSVLDLDTLVRTDLLTAPSFDAAHWDPTGARIAYLADGQKRLGIYSLSEGKVVSESNLKPSTLKADDRRSITWTDEGRRIAMSDLEGSQYVLRVYDDNLKDSKVYDIPQGHTFGHCPLVYGVGQKVLVQDFQASRLWVFDLAQEKWRKLF